MTPGRNPVGESRPQYPCKIQSLARFYVAVASFCECVGASSKGEMVLQRYFYIALGGALGSIARYWVGSAVAGRLGTRFPYGTFLVNLTACFLIGFSVELLGRHADINPAWRYLIPTGFIGAYSTFSTFEWETFSSLQIGSFTIAGFYVASSILLGLVGVWCGVMVAKLVSAG